MAIRRRPRTRGFVLVTMAVSSVVLLAMVGLSIDAGYLELLKWRMQTAADAAAVGGVQERRASGPNYVTAAARADSALNGFTHGVNAVTVTVNNPPAAGFYSSDPTAVEVAIEKSTGTLFMGVLGFNNVTVRARSVARQGNSPNCVHTLDPSSPGALSVSGTVTVSLNCGVMVNSTNATALTASGSVIVTTTGINVAGGYSQTGGAVLSPAPTTGVLSAGDPLAQIAAPAAGACNYTNYAVSAAATIWPGVYCGGISIDGQAAVTMNPGTYVLVGGGMTMSGGSRLTGTGVTIYNTYRSGWPYGPISISGGNTVQLSAPTTGPLAGILFFQDRSVTSGSDSSITGGSTSTLTGALYFPTTNLSYSGNAASSYTILVAKRITFTGTTDLRADYSSLPGGSPVKGGAALCE